MNKRSVLVELRPNRLLLDSSFGGYKLSLDPIPIYRKNIETGVKVIQPGDNQYSFYHVKIFSFHNHLHTNYHKPNSVYYIDQNQKVYKINSSPPDQSIIIREVFQIPNNDNQKIESYNTSIVFPSSELVIVSDGKGAFYLSAIRGDDDEKWELLHSDCLFKEELGCVLCDARIELTNNKKVLHVLFMFVEEKGHDVVKDDKKGLFQTKLKWRMFTEESNTWGGDSCKELCVNGSVDYVAFEPGCESIYVICDQPPKWVFDSESAITEDEKPQVETTKYIWTQTSEEITIWVPITEDFVKTDLNITVDDLNLDVRIKNECVVSGQFFHRVSKDLTTWTIEKSKIEIQIRKHEVGLMWKTLILGDENGEEIIDPEVVKSVHEKLSHLCSDKQETGSAPSFNSQQLEDCDTVFCETTSLFRINIENHVTTHEVSLSSLQWLFKVSHNPTETPAICVRHDVDACVWQFGKPTDGKTWPHNHIGTFSAFGYVQASKTQKKFVVAPQNLSYVAVCEASHRIYIYRQPSALNSELKNRHTGKKVDTISKQQLVNLESKDQILGVHATNSLLFVLLESSVCVLVIN